MGHTSIAVLHKENALMTLEPCFLDTLWDMREWSKARASIWSLILLELFCGRVAWSISMIPNENAFQLFRRAVFH